MEENGEEILNEWNAINDNHEISNRTNDRLADSGKMVGVKMEVDSTIRSKFNRSIAERRAENCGFNTSSPLCSSPITIPAGISPDELLDSPILLPNSQSSPTTGTFPSSPLMHDEDITNASISSSLKFKINGSLVSLPCLSSMDNQNVGPEMGYQDFTSVQPQADLDFSEEFLNDMTAKRFTANSANDKKLSDNIILDPNCNALKTSNSNGSSEQVSHMNESVDEENQTAEGQRGTYPTGMVRTSEDGYNWRKYGQKQVKGSEYPRSYYKCTHPNCQVKKKVERSHDGQIMEIIYKGAHNHPKPQPNRRSALGSVFSLNEMPEMSEGSGLEVEDGLVWRNIQPGSKDIKVGLDWRVDGLEGSSLTSIVTELFDPFSTVHGRSLGAFEPFEAPELSSTPGNHDDDEDGATQGSLSLGDDADDEDSESKRRKKEFGSMDSTMVSRAIREPRVVVQIESEVDILDDGYRWRKYGQKVVKGNPNPRYIFYCFDLPPLSLSLSLTHTHILIVFDRSYYKCTSVGCSVRKHVERASHNLKSVITTYEGKHNHEVPTARNGNHLNSNGGAFSASQNNLSLPRNSNIPKSETQAQDLTPHFERKPDFDTDFIKPSFLGTYSSDMKFGTSIYGLKFPYLTNTMPYAHQAAAIGSGVPDFQMPLPSNISRPVNLPLTGFNFGPNGKGMGSVQSFLAGQQQLKDNDMRFLRPKQEKDENFYENHLQMVDHSNMSSSSSVYQRMIAGFHPN
ncbi:WRKY domain [Dillenia turbinata]|uniref:WRKY domain n=1 Tax=Dillenia turbinata TaxID=194707 RepID=A0AAN8US81_9MAGN